MARNKKKLRENQLETAKFFNSSVTCTNKTNSAEQNYSKNFKMHQVHVISLPVICILPFLKAF